MLSVNTPFEQASHQTNSCVGVCADFGSAIRSLSWYKCSWSQFNGLCPNVGPTVCLWPFLSQIAGEWQNRWRCAWWDWRDTVAVYWPTGQGSRFVCSHCYLTPTPGVQDLLGPVGYPFHSWEWSMSKFPCSLTRNITSHSKENLTFHSLLRWKVIILQILATSLIQSLFERLGEYTFWHILYQNSCTAIFIVRWMVWVARFYFVHFAGSEVKRKNFALWSSLIRFWKTQSWFPNAVP